MFGPRRPHVMKPIVHQMKCCTNHMCNETIVPHVHPSHTTNVNHQMYKHYHYYPHTESMVNEVSNQHFNCGPGFPPGMPQGPGMGF
jgi:spore coat protein D